MSRVIFEGEKLAYKAHLMPCIRPCFNKGRLKNTLFSIMNMESEQRLERKKEGGALIRGEALIRDYTVCNFHVHHILA